MRPFSPVFLIQTFDIMDADFIQSKICSLFLFRNILILAFSLLCVNNLFSQVNVIMNHNNLQRTGWNDKETILATDNVSSGNFGEIFSRDVDDQIYAQPLVVSNVSIGGGTHNIVLVAT